MYIGDKLVNDHATFMEAADIIWSDENTEETPCKVFDEEGNEVEW